MGPEGLGSTKNPFGQTFLLSGSFLSAHLNIMAVPLKSPGIQGVSYVPLMKPFRKLDVQWGAKTKATNYNLNMDINQQKSSGQFFEPNKLSDGPSPLKEPAIG